MKKLVSVLILTGLLQITVFAQQPASKQMVTAKDVKSSLVAKLSLSEQAAENIIEIENEFYASEAAANFNGQNTEAGRKAARQKIHDAHVIRRSKLMAIPLTGRQMEDVISISEASRSKQKK